MEKTTRTTQASLHNQWPNPVILDQYNSNSGRREGWTNDHQKPKAASIMFPTQTKTITSLPTLCASTINHAATDYNTSKNSILFVILLQYLYMSEKYNCIFHNTLIALIYIRLICTVIIYTHHNRWYRYFSLFSLRLTW